MKRFWNVVRHIALGLVLLIAVAFLLGLAAPFISDSVRRITAEFDTGRGKSGLIYVESPEVYTRQRLVNDRYLQDAWLRGKLEQIEDPNTVWVDTVRLSRQEASVALAEASDAGVQGEDKTLDGLADVRLSFETQFKLQANARDEIRQMILENALDDRHDLTGNTVYGLKFDTSVLPGSKTRESPAIIVNMEANPLDRLNREWDPHALARYYVGGWTDESQSTRTDDSLQRCDISEYACAVLELRKMDSHFEAWRKNIEDRLNDQRAKESKYCQPESGTPLPTTEQRSEALDTEICEAGPPAAVAGEPAQDALVAGPDTLLQGILEQRTAVDRAVSFVMRIPDRSVALGGMYLDKMSEQARTQCLPSETTPTPSLALGELFAEREQPFSTGKKVFDLPPPWAPLFQFQVQPRLPETPTLCGYELDIQLNPLDVPLIFIPSRWVNGDVEAQLAPIAANLYGAGLGPLSCRAEPCIDGLTIWTQRNRADAAALALDDATLASLIGELENFDPNGRLCFDAQSYFSPLPEEIDPATGQLFGSDGTDGVVCGPGHLLTFRLGAYQFFRRMAQVETYTYAAFPRGDVSGVVTETVARQDAGAALTTAVGGLAARFGAQDLERTAAAEPRIINFAAGDTHELFDFGWAIVKDGVKEPMLASQLVLIAVPAYLTEIRLDIIKGFLDADNIEQDWAELRADYNAARGELTEAQRSELLETRVKRLFSGYERRTIRLKVPPDYDALDGVVVGNSVTTGPRINTTELKDQGCFRYLRGQDFSLAIPGERLWRSTVVTLDGKKADRIEVMPDMKGILATFANFSPAFSDNLLRTDAELVVWTSEGNDPTPIPLCKANPAPVADQPER